VDITASSGTAAFFRADKQDRGFTLIELVIAVSVVGILASMSFGSYQKYMQRTNRSAAQQFMLEIVNRQELYLLDARTYTVNIGNNGLGLVIPTRVASRYAITVTVTPGPPLSYEIKATPSGNQSADGDLTLDSDGSKTPTYKWSS
jgi:type IV pilus assembly protein PilE